MCEHFFSQENFKGWSSEGVTGGASSFVRPVQRQAVSEVLLARDRNPRRLGREGEGHSRAATLSQPKINSPSRKMGIAMPPPFLLSANCRQSHSRWSPCTTTNDRPWGIVLINFSGHRRLSRRTCRPAL